MPRDVFGDGGDTVGPETTTAATTVRDGTYHSLLPWRFGSYSAAAPAGTRLFWNNGLLEVNGVNSALAALYLNPADLPTITGKTKKLRLRSYVNANANGYPNTMTVGLWPVSSWGGASGVNSTIATLGVITDLSNSHINFAGGGPTAVLTDEIDFPAAGFYTLGVYNSVALAAGTFPMPWGELTWRYA